MLQPYMHDICGKQDLYKMLNTLPDAHITYQEFCDTMVLLGISDSDISILTTMILNDSWVEQFLNAFADWVVPIMQQL
jgi:hypothetical protein